MPKSLNTHLKSLRSLSSATTAYGSTNFCSLNKSKICACFSTDCDHKSQFFLQFYSLFLFWLINLCKFGEMCRNNRRKMMSNRHTNILKRVLKSMKKKLKRMKQRLKDARKQIDLNFICICIVYFTLLILIRLYETWHTHWLWLWFDLRFALVTLLSFLLFFLFFYCMVRETRRKFLNEFATSITCVFMFRFWVPPTRRDSTSLCLSEITTEQIKNENEKNERKTLEILPAGTPKS